MSKEISTEGKRKLFHICGEPVFLECTDHKIILDSPTLLELYEKTAGILMKNIERDYEKNENFTENFLFIKVDGNHVTEWWYEL